MNRAGRILSVFLCLAVSCIACMGARADQILVYFDLSGSAKAEDRNHYYLSFKKLDFRPGDTVIVLPLGRDTHEFKPVARVAIPQPDVRMSAKANREAIDAVLRRLRASVRELLTKTEKATYIHGAFIASHDYFVQQGVPPAQRKIYLFSDMIEQAGKLDFKNRAIPSEPDKSQLLPADLQATIHVLGVSIEAAKWAALENYWRKTVAATNSTLVTYRHSL